MRQLIKNLPVKSELLFADDLNKRSILAKPTSLRAQGTNQNARYNQRKYAATIVTFISNNQKMVIPQPSRKDALPQGKEETFREAATTSGTEISKLC